ncbi:hypothetical protein CDIK_1648 [Cucumispora dikerogammari]|nr:hypothetical protein CDIK_1648 [Cucumispora dikerogammari]
MSITTFITQVTNIPIISSSHQTGNEHSAVQHFIPKNNILTSKSVLDGTDAQVVKVWDLQDLISNSSTHCDSILIPLFEIEKKNLPQDFEKDSYFNKTNKSFCQRFSLIDTDDEIVTDLFKKKQGFEGEVNLFIVKNADSDRLTVYVSFTLTHQLFFLLNKTDLQFVNKTSGKTEFYYTLKMILITLDFSSAPFKRLCEFAKVDSKQKKVIYVWLKAEGLKDQNIRLDYYYNPGFESKQESLNQTSQPAPLSVDKSANKTVLVIILVIISVAIIGLISYIVYYKRS